MVKGGKYTMKKIIALLISLTIVLGMAGFSFAANEVQLKGVVTKISGSLITIKDSSGKEIIVEGNIQGIKVGDLVRLKGEMAKIGFLRTELTAQDVEFLTRKCSIDPSDVNVIPKLPSAGRENLALALESPQKNCDMDTIVSFKATRGFLRKYTPPPTQSHMPPKKFNVYYLTEAESQYINETNKRILDKVFEDYEKSMQNRGK